MNNRLVSGLDYKIENEVIFLLYIGIFFIALGMYLILDDIYDIKTLLKDKKVIRKEKFKVDSYFKLRFVVGCFGIVIGILSLINYFS